MAAPDLTLREVCFVQKIGTDDAGYNAVGAPQPRLTINAALADLAANYPAASATNFHIVSVGPGVFTEDAIALPPWTWIEGTCDGEGQPTTFISLRTGAANITLSAGWSANATVRGGMGDITINAAAGSPILDLTMPVPVAGNPARTVELFNVHHNLTSQIFEATGTGDIFRSTGCKQSGTAADTVAMHGGSITVNNLLSAAAVLFGDVGGIAAAIQAYGIYITSATGGVTFSTTSGAGVTARMGSSDNRNLTLNITGAGALTVSADAISIPLTANVFYTGTATTANLVRTTDSGGFAPGIGTFTQIIRTGNRSSTAWGTAGCAINDTANTFTDTSSAGAVAGVTCARSFGIPTFASAGGVVYAIAANVYIAGDPVITGGTATVSYGFYNVGKSRFDGTITSTSTGTSTFAGPLSVSTSNSGATFTGLVLANTAAVAVGNAVAISFATLTADANTWQITARQNSVTVTDKTLRFILGGVAQVIYFTGSTVDVQSGINLTVAGNTLLGGTTNGTGRIQLLGASGTSADGITFGTTVNIFSPAANALTFVTSSTGMRWSGYGAGALTTDASGNITAVSDARMKNVRGTYDRGLKEICGLQPKLFQWNKRSGLSMSEMNAGFIAQDVLDFIPEAVSKGPDGIYTFADRPVTAALVNAVKELATRLEAVESTGN